MWYLRAPAALVGLVAATLLPLVAAKPYPVDLSEAQQVSNSSQIEKRQCSNPCGFNGWLCCNSDETCHVENDIASCLQGQGGGNGWKYYTTTWVETDLVTKTSVYSTYVGVPTARTTAITCSQWQQPCDTVCCDSGYWCRRSGVCELNGGGSSGGIIGTLTPSAPLRPTSSTLIIVTATGSPTATLPFSTPIPTGVNGTLIEQEGGGGGLSGGAIAGIVIGVILGLLLLLLICFYCCAKSAFDAIMACFGLGRKRKHTHEETYIEEHHHSSGGGGRRWYGQGPARPARPAKSGGGFGNALGIAGALGALALALGLKRKHDRRDEKSETSYTGSYDSSYYTSTSSASSDRRSRPTRHSSRR